MLRSRLRAVGCTLLQTQRVTVKNPIAFKNARQFQTTKVRNILNTVPLHYTKHNPETVKKVFDQYHEKLKKYKNVTEVVAGES